MNVDKLRELLSLMKEYDVEELEISGWGGRVRISSSSSRGSRVEATGAGSSSSRSEAAPAPAAEENREKEEERGTLIPIKSPMVGTFYRAPAPEAEPYVEKGSHVSLGQTVCLIEAMKLMNEIEAEVEGTVEEILAENAKPVQYGQVLFLIRPS